MRERYRYYMYVKDWVSVIRRVNVRSVKRNLQLWPWRPLVFHYSWSWSLHSMMSNIWYYTSHRKSPRDSTRYQMGQRARPLSSCLESLGYANSKDALPIYIRDDKSDEDAFKVLQGQGFGILVFTIPKEKDLVFECLNYLKKRKQLFFAI